MRAVILAGGKGTRLRPYTMAFPKPLVPVGDRPILEILVRRLERCGVDRIDLCVGHLGELIEAYFSDSRPISHDVELRYHWEDEPLGTAGALRQIDDLDEPFLALNGDVLTDLDFAQLMKAHTDSDAALTIATHRKRVDTALGVIEHEGDGSVTGYDEKPTLSYTVSMGIYAYSPAALARIPNGPADFPDVVRALLDAGDHVQAYPFDGEWLDIGTPADYERAMALAKSMPELLDLG